MKTFIIILFLLCSSSVFAKEDPAKTRAKSITLISILCPACLVPIILNEGYKVEEPKKDTKNNPIHRNLASEPKKN